MSSRRKLDSLVIRAVYVVSLRSIDRSCYFMSLRVSCLKYLWIIVSFARNSRRGLFNSRNCMISTICFKSCSVGITCDNVG